MAEWLLLRDAAALTGYSVSGLTRLIYDDKIPPECVRLIEQGRRRWYEVSADAIAAIRDHKQGWHAPIKQPDSVISVPDPNGEYLGFELTPEEAARLKTVRELHRQYPTSKERYPAMMRMLGDG